MTKSSTTFSSAVFVYDQDCSFCKNFVRFVQSRIYDETVNFVPDYSYSGPGASLTKKTAIFWDGSRFYLEESAIGRVLLRSSMPLRLLGGVILFPPVRPFCGTLYHLVSFLRYKIPLRGGCRL